MKLFPTALFSSVLLASTLTAQTRISLGAEHVVATFARPTLAVSSQGFVPAFAAAGRDGHYLIAWSEFDDATYTRASLHTAALDPTGRIIEGSHYVAPALRANDPNAQYPAVAFDGERFLVAWIEGRLAVNRLVAMRFDRVGKPLDAVPQEVSMTAQHTYVAAAAGGGEFTLAYSRSEAFGSTLPVVARIAADGTLLERDRAITGSAGFWRDIESNGTSSLVVSEFPIIQCGIFTSCLFSTSRTFATVSLTTSHATAPALSLNLSPVGSGLATDGTRFLAVTWIPNTTIAQSGSLIRGQLTDPTGSQFIREFLIAKHPEQRDREIPGGRIDAVWNGSSYAIAYELRTGSNLNLNLTFVSQIGMALTDSVELASSLQEERGPVVLPLTGGRVLVLYERGNPVRPEIVARQATLSLRTRAVR